jgi:hypothetical protein
MVPLRRPWFAATSLGLAAALGATLILSWFLRPVRPADSAAATAAGDLFSGPVPAVREPPTRPAAGAALADGELVVGVTEGGQSRAYRLWALAPSERFHVVNDVLGGVPISVTYCPLYHCTRVFSGGEPGVPLDMSVAGVTDETMLLRADGHAYRQDSGAPLEEGGTPFPYSPEAAVVESWEQWRHEHPDTDVYVDAPGRVPLPEATETAPPPPAEPAPAAASFDTRAAWASVPCFAAAPLLIVCARLWSRARLRKRATA